MWRSCFKEINNIKIILIIILMIILMIILLIIKVKRIKL